MSRKRSASPQSPPRAKRQAVQSWLDTQIPYSTIELSDKDHRLFPLSPSAPPTLRLTSESSELQLLSGGVSYIFSEEMESAADAELRTSKSDFSIGPDMPKFRDHLRYRGVRCAEEEDDDDLEFPENWDELQMIKRIARESPEPTPEEHKEYQRTARSVTNEPGVMARMLPKILKSRWEEERHLACGYDKQWVQHIPLPGEGSMRLTDPKPDQAFGWQTNAFEMDALMDEALTIRLGGKKLGSYASPCDSLYWPVATVEGKGATGTLSKARLQNLHNSSIMLNNQHALCTRAQRTSFPYMRVMAVTVIVTADTAELSCHWIAKAPDKSLIFWARQIGAWPLASKERDVYIEMRRTIRNCVEWVRGQTLLSIRQDLEALGKLVRTTVAPRHSLSLKVTRQEKSSGQSQERIPTSATNRLPIAGSSEADIRQPNFASPSSPRHSESEGTTAATSKTAYPRKLTNSMIAVSEDKLRRGHPLAN